MIDLSELFGFNPFEQMQQDTTEYTLKVYLGDAVVNQGTIQGRMGAQQNMMQIIQQLSNERQPMKAVCSRNYYKWDGSLLHEETLEFSNKVWDNAHK